MKDTTGGSNSASGVNALAQNTTGINNAADGLNALGSNTSGNNNIGVGVNGGFKLTTGGSNIDIGNKGMAAESGKIRIGTNGAQTAAFIAGIYNVPVTTGTPEAVVVNSLGQLGMVPSSARFKHDIRDLGAVSGKLLKLRPVSFRYNNDPANTVQYGLVAEEVAKVYPELVAYGPDGRVITVRYQELIPMLLDQAQHQAKQIQQLTAQVQSDV
jgi:hypothetical protein